MKHAQEYSRTAVLPTGIFGDIEAMRSVQNYRARLDAMRGQLDAQARVEVSKYLQGGHMTIAPMEVTSDILDGRFTVPGGSGFMTDGVYFWRTDASEYVREYGIGVPVEFFEHIRQNHGMVPDLPRETVLSIDRFIFEMLVAMAHS